MERERWSQRMDPSTKVNSIKICFMDMDFTSKQMDQDTMESGTKITCMEGVPYILPMGESTKESSLTINFLDMEC